MVSIYSKSISIRGLTFRHINSNASIKEHALFDIIQGCMREGGRVSSAYSSILRPVSSVMFTRICEMPLPMGHGSRKLCAEVSKPSELKQ